MTLLHAIRCKVSRHDQGSGTVQDAVSELAIARETDPGATGDAESGKQTEAHQKPKRGKKP